MQPLDTLLSGVGKDIEGLLFDLDGTLLDDGRLSVLALAALWELHRAGLRLIGVTGRPACWGQALLRLWPVDAMLTENGHIGLCIEGGRITQLDRLEPEARRERQQALARLVAKLYEEFPNMQASDDVAGRLSDHSFDIAESVVLDEAQIEALSRRAQALGATVIRSSIQLHVSLDADDKASGAVHLLRNRFGIDETRARFRYAFVGDSDNDAPGFAAFHHSIAVANLSGRPSLTPRYRTSCPSGEGFCQVAKWLLNGRPQPSRS